MLPAQATEASILLAIHRFSEQRFVSAAHEYASSVKHIASCWAAAGQLGWLQSHDQSESTAPSGAAARSSSHTTQSGLRYTVSPAVQPWLNKLLFLRGAAYFFLPSVLPASYHWLLRLLGFQPDAEQARILLGAAAAQGGVVTHDSAGALDNVQHLLSAEMTAAAAATEAAAVPSTCASATSYPIEAAPAAPLAALIMLWVQGFFVRDVRAADRLLSQSVLRWRQVRKTKQMLYKCVLNMKCVSLCRLLASGTSVGTLSGVLATFPWQQLCLHKPMPALPGPPNQTLLHIHWRRLRSLRWGGVCSGQHTGRQLRCCLRISWQTTSAYS